MDSFLKQDYVKWADPQNIDASIVISSRVRLARNIKGLPFPHLLDEKRGQQVLEAVYSAYSKDEKELGTMKYARLQDLSLLDKDILIEKHLLSPELTNKSKEMRAFIVNDDGALSAIVNEEDHLRLQSLLPGLQIKECFNQVMRLDDSFEQRLDYAFDERRGYLTSCPTNVGTGMRASVMLHLPAVEITGQVNQIRQNITQLGMTARGLFGEGTKTLGNFFQISNQVTLGQTEEDICNYLQSLTQELVEQEQRLRESLNDQMHDKLKDRIQRSYGILKHAHMLNLGEALAFLSDLRLGIDMGFIKGIPSNMLNELIVSISPAHLQKRAGKSLLAIERDCLRAEMIKNKLNNVQ
jgi:protein arginine kinase